jgi:hypothetical protein
VKRLLERATRDLVRRGIRDGLLGGNGIWLALGAVAWLARWLSRSPAPGVVREQIRVGETITVTSVAPPAFGRRARKLAKAERTEAAAARRQVRSERKNAAGLRGDTAAEGDDDRRPKKADKKGRTSGGAKAGKGGRRATRA